jgi:two-component system chemotaxis sensor kinase CheA
VDPLEAIKVTFFQECEEQLSELEIGLLAMEQGETDSETVNAVFRAVHSIKGGAGAFSLEPLVRFAHVFETTLDDVRSGKLSADNEVVRVMLRAADVLADHVRAARDGGTVEESRSQALAAELEALNGAAPIEPVVTESQDDMPGLVFTPLSVALDDGFGDDFSFTPLAAGMVDLEPAGTILTRWTVMLRPKNALYAKANETGLLLRELKRLGEMSVSIDASSLPDLAALEPEQAYLTWTITLTTDRDRSDIQEVFEFVDGDCDLDIRVADDEAASTTPKAVFEAGFAATAADEPFDVMALIQQAQAEVKAAPPPQPTLAPSAPSAPSAPAPSPTPVAAAVAPVAPDAAHGAVAQQATIRVDLDRVDRLIDLVGELVINQAMLAQRVTESGVPRSSNIAMGLDELEHLTRDIQDSVMAIRAQPVKSVFQRMPRLVREVAAMTGKRARLITEGEGTEVDKTVIERLTDPITHMIRNAIDHGLERPEDRLAAGKGAEGTVRLSAAHRSGRIVIKVSDDGKGIDRPRVRQIAIDKGLIEADSNLSDEDVDNLIFMPGFSTASSVSDISGRGVGMDVVKRSIQGLGGRIAITSRPGQGSTFTLSLPLTLAVLDGMVVSVCDHTLVAPLTAIIESLQPKAQDVRAIGPDAYVIAIRDTYTPLIDVGAVLGYRTTPLDPTKGVALLVEGEGGARAALMVDAIQGQRQVVIKSLEANYRQVEGIAAATILGDGRVALILDVDNMVAARRREKARLDAKLAVGG